MADNTHTSKPTHYTVKNRHTGKMVCRRTRAAARKLADKLDNAHGSYIAIVTPVYPKVGQ